MCASGSELHYGEPGRLTRVSEGQRRLLAGLPGDVTGLCQVVQGVMLHPDLTPLYEIEVPQARKDEERELRTLEDMVGRIEAHDARPLVEARPPERRMLGTCRSFATLLCGLLRFLGTPARARCGFGRYFVPGRGEDHWVCEVPDGDGRWVLVDAQIDAVQRRAFGISFDTLDVGRDQFVGGGRAWLECRKGKAAWTDFGLSAVNESGVWWVLSNLVRDAAALNKLELLPWDEWGLMLRDVGGDPFTMSSEESLARLSADDLTQLDRLAELTSHDVAADAVRRAFENDDRFRVPANVKSAMTGDWPLPDQG